MANNLTVTAAQVLNARTMFIDEAQKARDARQIGPLEFLRCKRVWRNWDKPSPDDENLTVGEAVTDEIAYQIVKAGLADSPEAINWDEIDWAKLLDFIMQLLKMIMALFAL